MSKIEQKHTQQSGAVALGNMLGAQASGNIVGTQVTVTWDWLSPWNWLWPGTDSEYDAQKIKEVNKLLDVFSPYDLQHSIVAGCFSESELERLAEKQPVAEPDLLDGSFVVVDLDPDERRDLRAKIGLSDPVRRKKDEEEEKSIMLQQSFVRHRGHNFGVAPRPLSEKVPPSNVVDPTSIGKPYERIPGHERTTGDTKSRVLRVRVAEQGSLQGGRVTTLLTVKTRSP
jgi:hypothetical protein